MKINYKMFLNATEEPFLIQNINGKPLELHYMNDSKHFNENINTGRFYVWASDGKDYKLFIEKGFYEKVSYFFTEEINGAWLSFLDKAGEVRKKSFFISMLISFFPILLVVLLMLVIPKNNAEGESNPVQMYVLIGGFALSLIGNMFYSSRLNSKIQGFNRAAVMEIQNILTPEGFDKFIADQTEYGQNYFGKNEAVEEDQGDVLELDEVEVTEEVEVLEEVNYEKMTVAELRELAKELELENYSQLKKADLIDLIRNNK